MESDIMLGKNWKNVESQPHEKSCYTGETEHPICVDAPRKEEYSPVPQEFPAELPTNMTFFKNERDVREYEKSLSRMRAEDALVTTAMRLSLNASLTNGEEIWSRRPVEDVKSVSSGSQGQHPTKRRSGPSNTYSDH
ncbi:hypothetical protein HYFRA_00002476 [Hymenoscyphus fraxineus]|uniref:Uncharacterized protein n=1 Tax=Hymenoscyphus fraxineus TaxID=746836 RepID=A0A9N9PZD8_9HELO|nr:hypothetical protein HYFRA_00002476 [Hymenoscyphus fraxineus]